MRNPEDPAHQFAGEVEQAVAAFDATGDALADDRAGPREAGNRRLAPWRIVRMDDACRGAGLDVGAELDERLEQARLRRIAIVILAADLHQPGRGFGRRRVTRQRTERVQDSAHSAL